MPIYPGQVDNHKPGVELPPNSPAAESAEGKSPTLLLILCAPWVISQPRKMPPIFPLQECPLFIAYNQDQQTLSVKSQVVNSWGFAGHSGVSATAASYVSEWVWFHLHSNKVPIKLY